MKEIFREEKETLSIKLENGLVKEISAGFQAGKGTREIPTLAQVDYDFESQDFQNFSSASQDRQLKKVLPLLAEISAAAQDCHPAVKQVEITCQLNKHQVLI